MSKRNTASSLQEQFRSRVFVSDSGCHEWLGTIGKYGYGEVSYEHKLWKAHRLSWTFANGDIPTGMCVLHRCDNRRCINPDHLFLGTQQDNLADMKRKGRARSGGAKGVQLPQTKINEDDVRMARAMCAAGSKQRDVAKIIGVSQSAVSMIVTGRNWKYVE